MSKETLIKVIDTTPKDFKAFVKLADIEGKGTTLILQRYLTTHIETTIGNDEARALFKGLAQHFGFRTDSDGDEAERTDDALARPHSTPATSIIVVSGPRGCGKTKRADQISKHFNDAAIVEGDDFGAIVTIKALAGKVKNMVVLTNADNDALYHLRRRLTEAGYANQHRPFKDVMTEIQQTCNHNWQKRCCADIHQPDYLQCSLCDSTKEM